MGSEAKIQEQPQREEQEAEGKRKDQYEAKRLSSVGGKVLERRESPNVPGKRGEGAAIRYIMSYIREIVSAYENKKYVVDIREIQEE